MNNPTNEPLKSLFSTIPKSQFCVRFKHVLGVCVSMCMSIGMFICVRLLLSKVLRILEADAHEAQVQKHVASDNINERIYIYVYTYVYIQNRKINWINVRLRTFLRFSHHFFLFLWLCIFLAFLFLFIFMSWIITRTRFGWLYQRASRAYKYKCRCYDRLWLWILNWKKCRFYLYSCDVFFFFSSFKSTWF